MTERRQVGSFCPVMFNSVTDKLINSVKTLPGYKVGNNDRHIVCHEGDGLNCGFRGKPLKTSS